MTTKSFLKQQLSLRTGATISQIETNGVFSPCNYFAKTADSHQITDSCNISKRSWGLEVQKLDGTKLHVVCREVSIGIYMVYKLSEQHTKTLRYSSYPMY